MPRWRDASVNIKELLWETVVLGCLWAFVIGGYIAAPVLLVWGWARWVRRPRQWTIWAILSLAGLTLATASLLVAVSVSVYSRSIGDFPHFDDPLVLRMYRWGELLSRAGIVFGIAGLWRPSVIRWHAFGCAVGMLMFWMLTRGE